MQINYKKWVKSHYQKFPKIQKVLLEYWKTMHDLTKRAKPENFRYNNNDVFRPLLDFEIGPLYDKIPIKIIGWGIKFMGNYPDEVDYRKIMENAISNLLSQIHNTIMITSSLDITPFLNLTPDLQFLSLRICNSSKTLSPKIGLPSLKKLHTINFRNCYNLEYIPPEIGNLPNLRKIELEDCPKIQTLPESLAKIPTLKGIILGPNLPLEYPNLIISPSLEPYIHYRSENDYLMI